MKFVSFSYTFPVFFTKVNMICFPIGSCSYKKVEEKEAFWMLGLIAENLLPDFFSKSLWGLNLVQWIFKAMLRDTFPKLYEMLDELEISVDQFSTNW